MELFGDEGAHGPVEDPYGEGEVEVKKGRKEGWGVARLEESFEVCHDFGSLRCGFCGGFCGDFVVLMVVICGAEDTFGLAWGCVRCGPHIA